MNLQLIEPKSDYAQRGSNPFALLAIDSTFPIRGDRSLCFPYSPGWHEPS
jgi:hypothetical protein